MGRFSDFERKVDEMAELSDLERKAVQTWVVSLITLIGLTWLIDGLPYREMTPYEQCRFYGYSHDECVKIGGETAFLWDWTPTAQVAIGSVLVLVCVVASLRIWKRPEES